MINPKIWTKALFLINFIYQFKSTTAQCNGTPLQLTGPSGQAVAPNWPMTYPSNQDCEWKIDTFREVEITITDMDIEADGCDYDWMEIRFNSGGNAEDKYCGTVGRLRRRTVSGNGPVRWGWEII